MDADAERNRKNIPEELPHLVADSRVFASGIVSLEFASECEKKFSEYTEKADIIFGKWLWHTFEEIPLLGEEAVALTDALRFSTYNMEEDDKNLRIFNNNVSIKLIDVTFDRSSLSKMFDVRQCELYLETEYGSFISQ
ncbi:MAG: hypothetical protein E7Z66_02275 [Thermoplasmata archaeon]|nr:hypothetical protein [Thermoplasmata archaeon]